jgi:hypothetical protein
VADAAKKNDWTMKVVGRRTQPSSLEDFDALQKTIEVLSGGLMGPRGVFRFRTFEEANAWKMTMLAKAASRR